MDFWSQQQEKEKEALLDKMRASFRMIEHAICHGDEILLQEQNQTLQKILNAMRDYI